MVANHFCSNDRMCPMFTVYPNTGYTKQLPYKLPICTLFTDLEAESLREATPSSLLLHKHTSFPELSYFQIFHSYSSRIDGAAIVISTSSEVFPDLNSSTLCCLNS